MGRRLPSLAAPVLAAALALSACGGTTEGTPKAETPSSASSSPAKPAVSRPKELTLVGLDTCDPLVGAPLFAELKVQAPRENKPDPAFPGVYFCTMVWASYPGWTLSVGVVTSAGADDYLERSGVVDPEPGQVEGFPTYLADVTTDVRVSRELLVDIADGQALTFRISYFQDDFKRTGEPTPEDLRVNLEKAARYSVQALMSR